MIIPISTLILSILMALASPEQQITPAPMPALIATVTTTPTLAPMATVIPAPAVVDGQVQAVGKMSFGMAGQIQCYNCAPFSQKVHVTNYDPMAGEINCFDYEDDYCWSPTASGIHWKAVYGFGAACPPEWPYGTWVSIPEVGTFVCFDRGGSIGCNSVTGICAVDILGPGGPWNNQQFDATLWVPLNPPRTKK